MLIRSLLFALSTLLYFNTRNHDYTFDDQYALINNPDVLPNSEIYQAFHHDFWGQNIASPMSNKSYRPLTVLSFRAQTWLASHLRQEKKNTLMMIPKIILTDQYIHHMSNIIVHSINTVLLYMVAVHLFSLLHSNTSTTTTAAPAAQPLSPHHHHQKQQNSKQYMHNHIHHQAFVAAALFAAHPIHTEAVASIVGHAELLSTTFFLTALLIHLGCIKRLGLRRRRRSNSVTIRSMVSGTTICVMTLIMPTMLGWAAALSKETGITVLGALFVIDVYILTFGNSSLFAVETKDVEDATERRKKRRERSSAAAPENEETSSSATTNNDDDNRGIKTTILLLVLMVLVYLVLGLGSYITLRKHVSGGDHLVRIYRKVENPIPFAQDSALTRWLTTGHLHTKYTWLMLVPFYLSADWSYACVEYVSSLVDVRNLGTLAVYGVVVCIIIFSWKMLGVHDFLFNDDDEEDENNKEEEEEERGKRERKKENRQRRWWWSVAILVGLVVGPFLPASNIFFYVGTFIGERLLYIPSIGYCLLVASLMPTNYLGLLGNGMEPTKEDEKKKMRRSTGYDLSDDDDDDDDGTKKKNDTRSIAERTGVPFFNAKTLYLTIIACILILYSTKTVRRNRDWRDDATLFTSAALVCPTSAKVQLNLGILYRRWGQYEAAIHHFQLAEQAEPSAQFCEPKFHIAITVLSNSLAAKVPIDNTMAFTLLEKSLSCKYVAVEALKALNEVSRVLTTGAVSSSLETRVGAALRWAKTLCRTEIARYGDAMAVCEQASLLQATHSDTVQPYCQELLKRVQQQAIHDYTTYTTSRSRSQQQPEVSMIDWPLKQHPPLTTTTFHTLYNCVAARHKLIQYAAAHKQQGAGSPEAKNVWYTYLNINKRLGCRHLPINTSNTTNTTTNNTDSMGIHPQLIHIAQSADANDPWLQEEWGLVLSQQTDNKDRRIEAYQHTSAAAYLLSQKLQQMLHDKNSSGSSSSDSDSGQGVIGRMFSLVNNGTSLLTSPHEVMEGLERTVETSLSILKDILLTTTNMVKTSTNDNTARKGEVEEQQERQKLQSVMCQVKKMECHGMEMMASLGPDEEKLHWEKEGLRCQQHGGQEYCEAGAEKHHEKVGMSGGNTVPDEL